MICFFILFIDQSLNPKGSATAFGWGYTVPIFPNEAFGVYVSGFGTCRTLLDVSLVRFVVSLLSQIKHILGLADQCAHASTSECVRLCSEGKIALVSGSRGLGLNPDWVNPDRGHCVVFLGNTLYFRSASPPRCTNEYWQI